jgi:succinate-semialdehyde dehydrogenase/glutarate-semialdehyde dehydrogenase
MALTSLNPATGAVIREYDEMPAEEIREIIAAVAETSASWRTTSFAERATPMRRAAALLRERSAEYGKLMAEEMGKPLKQGIAEAEKCAWVCEYYAEHAEQFLAREYIETDASRSFVAFQPLGTVLAVMPWNFPFWQVFRFLAPALMAGNTGVLKHSSNVSGCALAIESVVRDAGFPDNVFRTLLTGSRHVGDIIKNPHIKAVTLTGSTPAGQAVAAAAGAVLKKTVLELGGSDPYIVLEDADLDAAAETCVSARLINSGQSCIAAKRFIVVDAVREKFTELFVETMRAKTMGNPLDGTYDIGPQARKDLRDDLHRQVEQSVDKGATLLLGGKIPEGGGAFYPPTVLADVRKGMAAYEEETFGPVAAIIPARNEAEAIQIANDTNFGLGAAVFTRDAERGERLAAEQLEAGSCFVNALVKSDPRLPFGGMKESGYGRELSAFGIREFVNVKTVYVK